MKYKNAIEIFPPILLQEIQKYACGEIIYIPQPEKDKKSWGELSGIRLHIRKRNTQIRSKFKGGISIDELTSEYFLAIETIKKIVYSKD